MKVGFSLPPGWFKARLYHLLAPLVALALVWVFEHFSVVERLEDGTVGQRFKARAAFDPPADPRLVFVGIDDPSLYYLGKWDWPRTIEAEFVKAIADSGVIPHTLTFDLTFTETSNKINLGQAAPVNDDDKELGDAVGELPSVITGALSLDPPSDPALLADAKKRTDEALAHAGPTVPLPDIKGDISLIPGSDIAVFPVQPIRDQSLFGFVNDDPSLVDDIRHTIPLVFRVQDRVYPSFALQTLCQMLNVDADKVEVNLPNHFVQLKNSSGRTWTIPTTERGEYFINYRRQDNFKVISFVGLFQNLVSHIKLGTPIAKDCDIANKTLIVGEDAVGLGDNGPTPLQGKSPLPYTHLNIINNVLQNDYISFVPGKWVVIGWALITWVTLLRLKDAPLVEAVSVPMLATFLYVLIAFGIFWKWSILITLAWPVLSYGFVNFGGVVLRWREEKQGRDQIKGIFSRMVSPEIMNHLLEHPENMKLGGSDRAATILFSDIRDYTKFSEGLAAAEVVRQLNIYFDRMVGCVTECKGTFHKFIGDAVMAAWGDIADASLGAEQDARNAVRSALKMRLKLRQLNAERQAEKLMPLRIGIGLNHGTVQAGMLGATGRMEFTVMGDEVNVASRLEGLTKEFHTDLAIGESVRPLIGDEFLVRRLGLVVLKGKTKPIVVFEVLAEKSSLAESKLPPDVVALYEEAFDHFLARRFSQAETGFLACATTHPDDYCVQVYLKASREFSLQAPPADWDGRIVMTTK